MKNSIGMTLPTCDILVNGQKRKFYGKKKNKIYLHNGDNFQLKLFNPLQERIGVQLKINGAKVDNDLLIVNPGQEVDIDRYIGSNRKLTFSSYEIDTNGMSESRIQEAKKAIEKNGILEIVFWNEKVYTYSSGSSFTIKTGLPHYTNIATTSGWCGSGGGSGISGTSGTRGSGSNLMQDKVLKKWAPVLDNLNVTDQDKRVWMSQYAENHQLYNGNILTNQNGMGNVLSPTNLNINITPPPTSSVPDLNPPYTEYLAENIDINIAYSQYIDDLKISGAGSIGSTDLSQNLQPVKSKVIETGRIEKGDVSSQHFSYTAFEVGEVFYKIKFKLLPFSMRPVKKNSMTQQQ